MKRSLTWAALLPLLFSTLAVAGETEQAIDRQINARVYAVLDSLTLLPTPSDPPLPPPPLPPPAPPPGTGSCAAGWPALGGFWDGWCGDETGNFLQDPAGFGVMRSNAQASRLLGATNAERWKSGWVSFDVYFAGDVIPTGGGKHLGGPTSFTNAQDPRPHYGWLRPDITTSRAPNWNIDTYNTNMQDQWPGARDVVCDVWNTGIPVAGVKQWIPVKLEWRRDDSSRNRIWYRFTASGRSTERTVTIQADSKDMGRFIVGNMDNLGSFGGTPRIYFRNMRLGR